MANTRGTDPRIGRPPPVRLRGAPDARRERRLRRRRAAAALVAAVAIIAAALAATTLVGDDDAPGEDEARRTVDRYLSAWEEGDVARMQRLVTSPRGELAATYLDAFGGLSITQARFELRRVHVDGDRGAASFRARLQLAGLGAWGYRGRLPLERDGSRWLVAWSPAALHPDLAPGLRLVASRAVPPRAPILGSDGSPLDGPALDLADVVGTVGAASAAEAAELGPGYRAGDTIGRSGLQATFEDQLAGEASGAVEVRDFTGQTVVRTLHTFPGRAPEPLATTLDPAIQGAAQQALADTTQPAALVAVDTSDGSVRAVVSRPVGGFPRALLGKYPPGSTFKIVTTTAALAAGVTPQEVIDCPPSVTVDGKVFVNAEGDALGPIPLTTAFARSCNTAFVNLADR
ncbi:MAG TPA: penicillin-binding transpeptidase domain-containing protein, partial [Acidimicrobiia bacterium]